MMTDALSDFSDALAARVASGAKSVVAITLPGLLPLSAILWRKGVAVTSEQVLAEGDNYTAVLPGGAKVPAKLAGRDPGSNVAAFTLEADAPALERSSSVAVGELAILVGADGEGGPTARLGSVRRLGPAWNSMMGGKIDRLIVLDANLRPDTEGGPVLDARGRLIGLATSGPRRRAMVIPHETIDRVLEPLLMEGRVARGWLGVGVQPVKIPDNMSAAAGRETGLMLASLAKDGPAEKAGLMPGDIILDLDGQPVGDARGLGRMFGPDRVGKPVSLRILRAGAVKEVSVTVGARPAR
jgi:S1-C subfamily serine protease